VSGQPTETADAGSSAILCVRLRSTVQVDRAGRQRLQKHQQSAQRRGGFTGKARQQAGRGRVHINRRHEVPLDPVPERRDGQFLLPPLLPATQGSGGNLQHLGDLSSRSVMAATPGRGQHHDQSQIDAATQESHRWRRTAPSATLAAEAAAPRERFAERTRTSPRFPWVVCPVQNTTTRAGLLPSRGREVVIDLDQKREKSAGGQKGMAHWTGLCVFADWRLSRRVFGIKHPEGGYPPSLILRDRFLRPDHQEG